jgi:YD repeat-containing protein
METQILAPTPGQDYPRTWNEFLDWFATEEACLTFLEKLRWPHGFICPRCGNTGDVYRASRTRLMCRACQYQGTVTSGTIFDKTRTPLRVWLAAAWYLTNQKQGVSALGLQRVLGLGSYQTAWTMLHRFRRAMVRPGRDKLKGLVEVDETYLSITDRKKPITPVGRKSSTTKVLVAMAVEVVEPKGFGRIRLRRIAREIEYEHRITHRLDALGNRQSSQLQGLGHIDWLRYGSGHVHGLQHEGSALIDFERDRLHRETGRTLQGQDPQGPSGALRVQRRWDALGRLQALASQGLQGQAQVPQVLVGQLSQRQYHYDALGQLTAVQTAQDTLRYGYDAAGRLRAMQEGGQQQRWDVDPAGNRLPGLTQAGQAAQANWAAQVHAHWRQQDFNLLGERQASAPGQGTITHWLDNRIGFTEHAAWRYDACGNRVEQLKQDGQRQRLGYDGGHQLIEVVSEGPAIGEQTGGGSSTSRYTYDALGRRLKKAVEGSDGSISSSSSSSSSRSSYFGWDGDRLIHTEHTDALKPEHRQITHTVYEPGSFTPLVQLSTRGKEQTKQHALMLAVQGADDGDDEVNAQMAQMLAALPQDMRHLLDRSIRQAAREGLTAKLTPISAHQLSNTAHQANYPMDYLSRTLYTQP